MNVSMEEEVHKHNLKSPYIKMKNNRINILTELGIGSIVSYAYKNTRISHIDILIYN